MKSFSVRIYIIVLLTLFLSGCGYSRLATMDKNVQSSWVELEKQFKERYEILEQLSSLEPVLREIPPGLLEQVHQNLDSLFGLTVIPGRVDSVEQFLLLQELICNNISQICLALDPSDVSVNRQILQILEEIQYSNQQILNEWNSWMEQIEEFNRYIQPFPRNTVALWLGFREYDKTEIDPEALIVLIPDKE